MTKQIRYTLFDAEEGFQAHQYHQDDSETPIVADTLAQLIDIIGEWSDCATSTVLSNIVDGVFHDVANGGTWVIKREEYEVKDLDAGDLVELKDLANSDPSL